MFKRLVRSDAAQDTQVAEDDVPAPARPQLHAQDFRHAFVLLCNFRTGSNLAKSTLEKAGVAWVPHEPFARTANDTEPLETSLDALIESDTDFARLMALAPTAAIDAYFATLFPRIPQNRKLLLDIKYSQAMRFGADHMDGTPVVLKHLKAHKVPIVHLVRNDFTAQAISHMLALRTGVFSIYRDIPDTKSTEFESAKVWLKPEQVYRLACAKREMTRQAGHWLNAIDAKFMTIRYEEIAAPNWVKEYQRVLEFIGHYAEFPDDLEFRTKKQNSSEKITNLQEILDYVRAKDATL